MFRDVETTPEDEEEMITSIAEEIHRRNLDEVALIVFRSLEPLNYIGMQAGRLFVAPFLPAFGDNLAITGNKVMQIFEKTDNVKKLLNLIEEMARNENDSKEEDTKDPEEKITIKKKGWRRYLPF